MKKHVLGAALFTFIVASFAIVFATFFSPFEMPAGVTVRSDRPEAQSHCDKMRRDFVAEIVSSNYFVTENKIVTKIRLTQRQYADIPDKVSVALTFSSGKNMGESGLEELHVLDKPFADGREAIWTVETKVGEGQIDLADENFYVNATIGRNSDLQGRNFRGEVTQTKSVLFVYGLSGKNATREQPLACPKFRNADVSAVSDSRLRISERDADAKKTDSPRTVVRTK